MTVTSTLLFVRAEELRLYSVWLHSQADGAGAAIDDADEARERVSGGWKGPLPVLVDQSARAYLGAVKEASPALAWVATVVGDWGAAAGRLADELQFAERYAESFETMRASGAGFGGIGSEETVAWSRVAELEQSWDPECMKYIGRMETAVRALAACKDATATDIPVPPHLLAGNGYLATIGQLVYFFNYPGGVTPDPADPLTFAEVDPELQAIADAQAQKAKDNPWIFTAYETANHGDIDAADNNGEWQDLQDLTSWDVSERQVRQMNEQLGWGLTDEQIAARTQELVAFAWLSLGRVTNEPLAGDIEDLEALEGDEWVHPEMEDLDESDTSHEATLNPFSQLQDIPWTDLTQDQRRLLHILEPYITDPNRGVTWQEWCNELGPLKLIFDPGAMFGTDATWFTRTLEGIGVVPFGKVFKWGDEVIDLIRGVENATDVERAAETGVDVLVHGDEFVEGATELVGVSDEGITTFDNVVTDAGDNATDTVDDVFDRVDDSATSGADGTADGADEITEVDSSSQGESGEVAGDEVADDAASADEFVQSEPSSRELGDNLVDAGEVRPPGTDAHHIVAGNHPLADDAREILDEFGIDINSAENGVFLPAHSGSPNPGGANIHRKLNADYYREVSSRLAEASTREEALEILQQIEQRLLNGDMPQGPIR